MNHIFCSNCVQISNFQMAVKPKPFNGIAPYFKLKNRSIFGTIFFEILSNLGSKNNLGSTFFESKLLEISKKINKK